MTRPTCEDCPRPADLIVHDYSRGYQASRDAPSPARNFCNACLKARQDDEADDPWPTWADPRVLHRYTDPTPPEKDTTMTDQPTLTERLTPLVAELTTIAEQKADLDARERGIKAQIRGLVPGADTYDAGGVTVVVSHNRRFNEKRALPLIPEALVPVVTYPETRIDKDKLKALLPDVYDAAQDVYDDRVSVK
jgi:hypothetical protein